MSGTGTKTVRVLVVDDHGAVRDGWVHAIKQDGRHKVVAEASDGEEAVRKSRTHKPDVILMDISMPGMDGIEATRAVLQELPDTKIIGVTGFGCGPEVSDMLRAGAAGIVLKSGRLKELVVAIDTVTEGGAYLTSGVANSIATEMMKLTQRTRGRNELSDRERQVLKLSSRNLPLKEIAARLKISIQTVDSHRRNIRKKLGLRSNAELVHHTS
jgi:two-component system nitrate/nitrite response regulator NarL